MLDLALDISLRSVAAAAAVGLVLSGFRVRSGAARHAAWAAVVVTMMTMPMLMAVVPRVDVPVPSAVASSLDTIADQVNLYPRQGATAVQDAGGPSVAVPVSSTAPAATTSPTRAVVNLWDAVAALYFVGLVFCLVRIAVGWLFVRRLVTRAVGVSLTNRAPVYETPAIATPMTTGVVSPCILLPVDWRVWPDDTLRAVLAHENAHIVRRDALVALLARVNRAFFWFHPLAWWLERTLAVEAEYACDETAAREVGRPHRYAAVLLEMAEATRRRGCRVSWQTLGMNGSKVLGARIDRLVKGDVLARMSAWQRASVAVACAAMLVMAIACRQQIAAAPLRVDPDIQKQITDRKAREERHRAAVSMTAPHAAALERSLESNPDNVDARESLIIFYDQSGTATWEQKLAGIRKHALWRIAHLPVTDLWIPNISKRYDPDGYAQAKALWLQQTSRMDVTAQTLGRAAAFFKESDKPLAEQLLIRAQAMESDGPWGAQLMALYAEAIGATVDARHPGTAADHQFAADARRKIEASTDPNTLANAAAALRRWAPAGSDVAALTRRLFERAVALDPANVRARTGLADLEYFVRQKAIDDRLRATSGDPTTFDDFGKMTSAAVLALPIDDRLFYLPWAAELAYMRAENVDYTARQKPTAQQAQALRRAEQGFAQARQYANEALALAHTDERAARDNEVVYRAESVLGVLALKDGDRKGAVAHMRAAGAAPLPDPIRYRSDFGMRSRLVEYLLRIGERTSVADYLEQSAARRPLERDQLLKDAARVRDGMMPASYQYAEARR